MKLLSELLKNKTDLTIPASKPRNPTHAVLANRKNAAGPMDDKKRATKNGETKHKGKMFEAKKQQYQVRIQSQHATDDWRDIELGASTLEDIADSVSAHPMDTKAIDKFGLHELVEIVENFIGAGPNGRGTWDEMDFDVKSLKDDVLKISWAFSGVDMSKLEKGPRGRMYGTPISKSGVITIMPAAK